MRNWVSIPSNSIATTMKSPITFNAIRLVNCITQILLILSLTWSFSKVPLINIWILLLGDIQHLSNEIQNLTYSDQEPNHSTHLPWTRNSKVTTFHILQGQFPLNDVIIMGLLKLASNFVSFVWEEIESKSIFHEGAFPIVAPYRQRFNSWRLS